MNTRPRRIERATLVWLLLLGITAAAVWLGNGQAARDDRYIGVAIVALAFVKIRFVMLEFMEIRNAPFKMRLACEAWVIIVGTTIIAIYLH